MHSTLTYIAVFLIFSLIGTSQADTNVSTAKKTVSHHRKLITKADSKENQNKIKLIEFSLAAAKAEVQEANNLWKTTTGRDNEDKKFKELEIKIQAMNSLEIELESLRATDNPNKDLIIKEVDRRQKSEWNQIMFERTKKWEEIQSRVDQAILDNKMREAKEHIRSMKKEQEKFFRDLEREDEALKKRQEAERKQMEYRRYTPLE